MRHKSIKKHIFLIRMAGLYIHIPFCKSRCIYCGFYSTTNPSVQTDYVDALCHEMDLRKHYLDKIVHTIYIGGGTPSQLSVQNLNKLFSKIYSTFDVDADAEVTMECNPDDTTEEYCHAISLLPVNRISMGAQTFNDTRLKFLHRRHTSQQIGDAVSLLRNAGIHNISIDLMYGFPKERTDEWDNDIEQALRLNIEHISAYCLMYEDGTPLYRMLQKKEIKEVDEEVSREMYEHLIDRLTAKGYKHYEISNFARDGYQSRHNSSYWKQIPYLGIGAAAHSFNIDSRQWNVSDIKTYMERINNDTVPFEREEITPQKRYNDTVFTALRTAEGLDMESLKDTCGSEMVEYCLQMAKPHLDSKRLKIEGNHLILCREGIFVSDDIMSDLMKVD